MMGTVMALARRVELHPCDSVGYLYTIHFVFAGVDCCRVLVHQWSRDLNLFDHLDLPFLSQNSSSLFNVTRKDLIGKFLILYRIYDLP